MERAGKKGLLQARDDITSLITAVASIPLPSVSHPRYVFVAPARRCCRPVSYPRSKISRMTRACPSQRSNVRCAALRCASGECRGRVWGRGRGRDRGWGGLLSRPGHFLQRYLGRQSMHAIVWDDGGTWTDLKLLPACTVWYGAGTGTYYLPILPESLKSWSRRENPRVRPGRAECWLVSANPRGSSSAVRRGDGAMLWWCGAGGIRGGRG